MTSVTGQDIRALTGKGGMLQIESGTTSLAIVTLNEV